MSMKVYEALEACEILLGALKVEVNEGVIINYRENDDETITIDVPSKGIFVSMPIYLINRSVFNGTFREITCVE